MNVVWWLQEFWAREQETNREFVMSRNRLYVVKLELDRSYSVNSAGFKTNHRDISEAAHKVGVEWMALSDAMSSRGNKDKIVFVSVRETGDTLIY